MPTKIIPSVRYRCDICGVKFTTEAEAIHCEQRGVVLPRFVSGDVVDLMPTEMQRLGLTSARVLIDQREFVSLRGPSHGFALADRGVKYHVRAAGGAKYVVEAVAVVTPTGDMHYCRNWPDFLQWVDNGRPNDALGLDQLKAMLNQRLNLGV
ncbi:MAG: hypothetical protein V1738_03775 [Patescibacteria group bacterium]